MNTKITIPTPPLEMTPWAKMPPEIVNWLLKRGNKPPASAPFYGSGIYLFAHAREHLHSQKPQLTRDEIVYVGKASLQTFWSRWTNTHRVMKKLATSDNEHFFSVLAVSRQEMPIEIGGIKITLDVDNFNVESLERSIRTNLEACNDYYRIHRYGH